MIQEKRRWRRYPVEDSFLTFREEKKGLARFLPWGTAASTYPVVDISMTGILFQSDKLFPRNEMLSVTVRLAHLREPLQIKAAVRRAVNRPGQALKYWIALRFMEFEGQSKELLKKLLDNSTFRMLALGQNPPRRPGAAQP